MKKDKFLDQVARYYAGLAADGCNLADYVLVFPNKRSAMFMRKYLRMALSKVSFMPRLITITSFTQSHCSAQLGRPTQLLFLLYKAYVNVMKAKNRDDQIRDFDSFAFWGNVIIDDFSDVDSFLVDPQQLFPNIASEKSIRSTFETEAQLQVARRLGLKEFRNVDEKNFWMHSMAGDGTADKFLALWQVLGDIYLEYNRILSQKGLAYSGMLSRQACENICALGASDFEGKRFGFVGFPVLSASRHRIFKHLKNLGLADFFWDIASPFLYEKGNRADDSILPLARQFPMPQGFELQPITFADLPLIEICPVPSNIGQTKIASQILGEWKTQDAKKDPRAVNFDNTWGIVLPNDRLLVPMLTALPADVGTFNVAMQVSFSSTPFAALLSSAIDLQCKARMRMGELSYLYKDVFEILSQPYIAMIAPESARLIKQHITDNHLYHIEASWIVEHHPDLAFIFAPVADPKRIDDVRRYLCRLFAELREKLSLSAHADNVLPYEEAILKSYEEAVAEICGEAEAVGVDLHQQTFFAILRRLLGALTIPFNSNPVLGLQLLGVQETRNLDFDNLIMMSLNERIFPKKTFSPSFIPPVLRVAYGMPTLENEDINLAYQFYRLIARAERLCILYDSRNPSMSMGELSRYVRQLRLLHPRSVKVRKIDLLAHPSLPRFLEVEKTPEVLDELKAYLTPGSRRRLSASALKTYLACPLRFYLETVKRLKIEDFDAEYMDAASFGTILHEMGRVFYSRYIGKELQPSFVKSLAEDKNVKAYIRSLALEIMDRCYYHGKYAHALELIPAEGRVLAGLLTNMFVNMLKREGDYPESFMFVAGEETATPPDSADTTIRWAITPDLTINFTMSIDRIDFVPETKMLRFIDYKTGSDKVKATDMDKVFNDKEAGAIFQLFTYAMAFSDNRPAKLGNFLTSSAKGIQPVVYVFNKMESDGIPPIKVAQEVITDFCRSEAADKFREEFVKRITEIFNPNVPFSPKKSEKNCMYCPFLSMCE